MIGFESDEIQIKRLRERPAAARFKETSVV
jgi:hypothetical protein